MNLSFWDFLTHLGKNVWLDKTVLLTAFGWLEKNILVE